MQCGASTSIFTLLTSLLVLVAAEPAEPGTLRFYIDTRRDQSNHLSCAIPVPPTLPDGWPARFLDPLAAGPFDRVLDQGGVAYKRMVIVLCDK